MDASVALMNQYTMIASQFPLPTNIPATTSVGTSTATAATTNTTSTNTETTNATANVETVETQKSDEEQKKPTASLDSETGPSTSKAANSIKCTETDSMATIEDIGRNDSSDPDESEVRRRRLQRFEAKGVDS